MMNTMEKMDEKFRNDILGAAKNGDPKIEIKNEESFMESVLSLYTQLNIQLNFIDPFKIIEVKASPIVSDGKVNMSNINYQLEGELVEKTYKIADFEKVLNDKMMNILIDRFNSYIKQLQDSKSEIYTEHLLRTKKSILYLLKQAKIKYATHISKFKLDNKVSSDGSYVVIMENSYSSIMSRIKSPEEKAEDINLKVKKPHTIREKDFKDILLKAIRKMNLLMK